jgi:hypothetical protein
MGYKPTGRPTGRPSKQSDIRLWLQDKTANNLAALQTELLSEGRLLNYSKRSLVRGKKDLNLESVRHQRAWWWATTRTPIFPAIEESEETTRTSHSQVIAPSNITENDIINWADGDFGNVALTYDGLSDFTEVLVEGGFLEDDRGKTYKVEGVLPRIIKKVRDSGANFTDDQSRQLVMKGLDRAIGDKTLSPTYRSRLHLLRSRLKPVAPQTFTERVSKMSLQEVDDLLRSFDDMESKGVTITEEMSKNKEIVCARLRELEPQPQNTSVF